MKLLCFNSKDGCSKIWILCSISIQDPKVFSNSDQEITLDFGSSQNFYRISFIYASVNMGTRRKLWQRLHNLCPPTTPWLLLGDFNAILGSHERVGGKPPNATSCSDFSMMIDNCNLEEIPTKGSPFTWARLSSRGYMECRLDRALCNSHWLDLWDNIECFTLPRLYSDHNPLVLNLSDQSYKGPKPFRFMKMWTEHIDFKKFIESKWKSYTVTGGGSIGFYFQTSSAQVGSQTME